MVSGLRRSVKRYPLAYALTVFLFAIWGGAHRIFGIVTPQFDHFFSLTSLQASIVRLCLNTSYLLVALPVALFLRRFGYKLGLLSGLVLFAVGALVLYPAVVQHQVAFHFASVIVTGTGWAFLEVSANTLIVRMGPSATAVRRLNFAQCFYPVGVIAAGFFAPQFTMPPEGAAYDQFVNDVVRPYVVGGLAVLLFALVVETLDFPELANRHAARGTRAIDDLKALWRGQAFRIGVAAMAIYSMGLSCLWGTTVPYARHVFEVPPAAGWTVFMVITYLLFGSGRIAGTALMASIVPARVLAVFAAMACVLSAIAAAGDGYTGLVCMLGANLFVSIMFPTIFARTIQNLETRSTMGAGTLVAASGLGGFAGLMAQHAFVGTAGIVHVSMAVAAAAFALIVPYALTRKFDSAA